MAPTRARDRPAMLVRKPRICGRSGLRVHLPRGIEIYGQLNNFLNQKYEESFGYPALHLNFIRESNSASRLERK